MVDQEALIRSLAGKLSEEQIHDSVKEAGEHGDSIDDLTAIEKLAYVLENENLDKIASDNSERGVARIEAIQKLAQEAEMEQFMIDLADLTSEMVRVKQAHDVLEAVEAEEAYQEEYEEKEASDGIDVLDQILG